jgi:phosphoribosylaminoimidazole-succinocarboxamide synthase
VPARLISEDSEPFLGQVLNQLAKWWFSQTKDIVENGLLSTPHPNVACMPPVEVFPIEFVVRGYVTGSTDTSIWTHYKVCCSLAATLSSIAIP